MIDVRNSFTHYVELSVGGEAPLPTEVLLFVPGANTTSKGVFTFDAQAAHSVMSCFKAEGVDLMIDLQHLSLDYNAQVSRTDAEDARGWCKLEVRDGALWAVGITWTPDGEERLRSKKQRYFSPAFETEGDNLRIMRVLNIALVSMPATYNAQPLVAASKKNRSPRACALGSNNMDPELVQKALDALESGDSAGALEILKQLIASAAGAPVTPETPSSDDAMASAADVEDKALANELRRFTGRTSAVEAIAELSRVKVDLDKIADNQKRLDDSARRELIGDLVKLGAETPATAWADRDNLTPVDRLAKEDLAGLRARVVALKAAKGSVSTEVKPPAKTEDFQLSAYDQTLLSTLKTDEQKARFIAARKAAAAKRAS